MAATILVIDDDEVMILLIKKLLEARGYAVITAQEGAAGVRLARERRPDVITLDFNMPDQNGQETFHQLRGVPETAVIPVLFLSATMTGLIERMVVKSHLVRFLKKPCKPDELARAIAEILAMPRDCPPPVPPAVPPRERNPWD